MTETLDGLEAETEDDRVYLLKNYRKYRQTSWHRDELPFRFDFEEYGEGHCPQIAVASSQRPDTYLLQVEKHSLPKAKMNRTESQLSGMTKDSAFGVFMMDRQDALAD